MDNQNRIKEITNCFTNNQLEMVEQNGALIITAHQNDVYDLCEFLKTKLQYDYLQFITCIDLSGNLQLQYYLYSYSHQGTAILKTTVERLDGKIKTVSSIWKTADWHEREIYDLFGVSFKGHPEMRRILLEDDFQGHPLLKDFSSKNMVKLPKV